MTGRGGAGGHRAPSLRRDPRLAHGLAPPGSAAASICMRSSGMHPGLIGTAAAGLLACIRRCAGDPLLTAGRSPNDGLRSPIRPPVDAISAGAQPPPDVRRPEPTANGGGLIKRVVARPGRACHPAHASVACNLSERLRPPPVAEASKARTAPRDRPHRRSPRRPGARHRRSRRPPSAPRHAPGPSTRLLWRNQLVPN